MHQRSLLLVSREVHPYYPRPLAIPLTFASVIKFNYHYDAYAMRRSCAVCLTAEVNEADVLLSALHKQNAYHIKHDS